MLLPMHVQIVNPGVYRNRWERIAARLVRRTAAWPPPGGPQHSKVLQGIFDKYLLDNPDGDVGEILYDTSETTCSSGTPDETSSLDEMLSGFALAQKAAGQPVWYVEDDQYGMYAFFIGDEASVGKKLQGRIDAESAKNPSAPTPKNSAPTEVQCPICKNKNWSNEKNCWSCGNPL